MRGACVVGALALVATGASDAFADDGAHVRRLAPPSVTVPATSDGVIELREGARSLSVRLVGATQALALRDGEVTRYDGALGPGTELTITRRRDGFEDVVRLDRPNAERALRYEIALEGLAGLRLIGETLEVLDDGGTPVFRMAPPIAIDPSGDRRALPVSVEGCAVDHGAAPPWGRGPVAPGAATCVVVVDLSAFVEADFPLWVDPVWSTTASMLAPRAEPVAVRLSSGRVLVVGQADPGGVDAELYDPTSGTFAVVGEMSEPRGLPVAVALASGAEVLVVGGHDVCDGCEARASAEVFHEATGLFQLVGAMSTPRELHAGARTPDGRVLVVGGRTGIPGGPHLATSDVYDPSTGAFSPGPSLMFARSEHSITTLADGSLLVAGGAPGPKGVERLAPSATVFVSAGNLAAARYGHGAVLLDDGRVLVAGGRSPSGVDSVLSAELFEPSASGEAAWSSAGELLGPHSYGALTALTMGRAVMAGGCCSTAAAELFDPARLEFVATSSLEQARVGHAQVALSPTTVLAIGGVDLTTPLATAEVFSLSTIGDPCVTALGCAEGYCVDDVCCDLPCDDACSACSAEAKAGGASGTCGAAALGAPDPRGLCDAGGSECGTTGLCDASGACAVVPEGTSCGAMSCPTGSGTCAGLSTCACDPPTCSEDGLSVGETSCAPYVCAEGTCLTECRTSTECSAGHVCNAARRCTVPQPVEATSCACALGRGDRPGLAWLGGWLVVALVGRRWMR